jgi:hypothetical protein
VGMRSVGEGCVLDRASRCLGPDHCSAFPTCGTSAVEPSLSQVPDIVMSHPLEGLWLRMMGLRNAASVETAPP